MKRLKHGLTIAISSWSPAASAPEEARSAERRLRPGERLAFGEGGRYHAGRIDVPAAGTMVLLCRSPRPLRIWLERMLVLDEDIFWRSYQRELRAAIVLPCRKGSYDMLVEFGPRPRHPEGIDRDCPSRNRERVMREIARRRPDVLELDGEVVPGAEAPAVSIRFLPAQFVRNGTTYQHVMVRRVSGAFREPPGLSCWSPVERTEEAFRLFGSVPPGAVIEGTSREEREHGWFRFYVPVADPAFCLPPVRDFGPEKRAEPEVEIAGFCGLTVEGERGSATVKMPVFESLGRCAPRHEYQEMRWPQFEEAWPRLPQPVLPEEWKWMSELYRAAWEMLFGLARHPAPESGLPGPYISTGSGFKFHQFVWDTSFTAMATAYGHQAMPAYASLDVLYSRQFDGGYIHREHDVRDGLPALYEPDFSPNPPIMSVAEWAIYRLAADIRRLRAVYPVLKGNHIWLRFNRRLPDGTYWTTGLANGLDNSPSLGEGYPCLTAQMAHDAEMLGLIAGELGMEKEKREWMAERDEIAEALNRRLWDPRVQIYSTSLRGGGHNPNKVVTAFWPLWAGIVPQERVAALARHAKDPSSFWRHHPLPSLAADSPHFRPAGDYWLGSTWAPTNFAAIKGFQRSGRADVALDIILRHLRCMYEVWKDTGKIWENYCSEESKRGSWSMPDYCWSAAGPIAGLFEVVLGFEADAARNTLRWRPPCREGCGAANLPFGDGRVSVILRAAGHEPVIETDSNRSLDLEVEWRGAMHRLAVRPGRRSCRLNASSQSGAV